MTVEAGELVVRIVGSAAGLERNVTSQVGRATSSIGRMGRSLGLAFGGAAIVGGITKTLTLAKDFDLTMRQVGVQTDQTGKGLEHLTDLALKMGQDTVYSAQDAGDAMLELAKGGLTSAQIKAGALKTAMTLAAAGGLELADSASAVVNGMGAFGLNASQASRVATALAGAANASSADVSDMTQALAQAGAQASATGLSIEDTAAALAIFANQGVKGSDAGTSLKTMLQNLIPTTVTQKNLMDDLNLSFVDTHGNFVGLDQIAGRLKKSMEGLTQAQRVQAMRTLFGSDASRAALFLYKAGAQGVDKMTKATHDQSIVQKMAQTTMEGAAGAWENFTGSLETAAIRLGTKALPMLTELLNWGSDMIGSADDWGPKVVDSFDGVRHAAEALWPLVRDGAEFVGDLVQWFGDLPGPVQQAATTAGIAALAMPRLSGAITTVTGSVMTNVGALRVWRTEMMAAETRSAATARAIGKFAGVAKAAAGVGGIVALTAATKETNRALKVAEYTAGGAAVGFSMGGPWGAALGGLAGGFGSLIATIPRWKDWEPAVYAAKDYMSTLNQVTGAITKHTRAMVLDGLQEQGLVQVGNQLGVTTRDMIDAALGNANAASRVGKAWKETGTVLDGLQNQKLSQWLAEQGWQIKQNQNDIRTNRDALKSWDTALKGVRPSVKVKLETLGYELTRKQFHNLDKQADLTARERKIILREVGIMPVIKQLKGLDNQLGQVSKSKADLSPFVATMLDGLSKAQIKATFGTTNINKIIKQTTGKARADLTPFQHQLAMDLSATQQPAHTGGARVGSELKSGALAGVGGLAALLSGEVAGAVNSAIAAGRKAADSHSPSRKMFALGADLTKGGVLGVKAGTPAFVTAMRMMIAGGNNAAKHELLGSEKLGQYVAKNLIDQMVGSRDDVQKAASHLADLIADAFDKRQQQREHAADQRGKARDKQRSALEKRMHAKGTTDLEKQRIKHQLAALKAADRQDQKNLHEAEQRDNHREKALRHLIHDQEQVSAKLGREWDKNHKKLQDARQAVKDLQQQQAEYAKSVADSMVAAANITADMPEGVAVTVASITNRMRTQVQQATDFAANIQKLIKSGLDQAYIDQLVQAGVEGGGLEAGQLANASADQIKALNDLMAQLQTTGAMVGYKAGGYLYDAGIDQAKAFVTQLEKEEGRIEKMMRREARAFAKELREALDKIKDQTAADVTGGGGKKKPAAAAARTTADPSTGQPLVSIGQINNPVAEPASTSVATRLRRLSQTGVLLSA